MVAAFSFLRSAAVATALFALAVSASPLPEANPEPVLKDIHATSLNLLRSSATNENPYGRFAVQVERIDEIVDIDEKSGDVDPVAARITEVVVSFDVTPTGDVFVNDIPVPMGTSNLKVDAELVMGVKAQTIKDKNLTNEEVANAFDKGVVALAIHVAGRTVVEDGIEFTRLLIGEQITEINGKTVNQKELIQQVIEIHPNGHVIRGRPCKADKSIENHLRRKVGCAGSFRARTARWFHRASSASRLLFAIFAGTIMGVIALMMVRLVAGLMNLRAYHRLASAESPVILYPRDEKLPEYNAAGYTGVHRDEKSEMKQAPQ